MNTYLYAPKDDYKHRLDWRELYTDEQAGMCLSACLHIVSFCSIKAKIHYTSFVTASL